MQTLSKCPGYYCGRHLVKDGNETNWSACGSCPRGSRANSTWACTECNNSPTEYDWMYLCFMVLIGIVIFNFSYFSSCQTYSIHRVACPMVQYRYHDIKLTTLFKNLWDSCLSPDWNFTVCGCNITDTPAIWVSFFEIVFSGTVVRLVGIPNFSAKVHIV